MLMLILKPFNDFTLNYDKTQIRKAKQAWLLRTVIVWPQWTSAVLSFPFFVLYPPLHICILQRFWISFCSFATPVSLSLFIPLAQINTSVYPLPALWLLSSSWGLKLNVIFSRKCTQPFLSSPDCIPCSRSTLATPVTMLSRCFDEISCLSYRRGWKDLNTGTVSELVEWPEYSKSLIRTRFRWQRSSSDRINLLPY